jgi:signal transduction histidine kinase
MERRLNYSGLVIAGIGFFGTRFTVTLATYEQPIRFALVGILPLALGLGLAAFGVVLTVADVEPRFVRTTALWCAIGTAVIALLALLTLLGSNLEGLSDAIQSRTAFSNVIIGGSVGGTLTGLYAARNRRQQRTLRQQADRLEVLNRLLRDEVLNAVTVIQGYTGTDGVEESDAIAAIDEESMGIERTVEEVKRLTRGPGSDRVDLRSHLEASIGSVTETYPAAEVSLEGAGADVKIRGDRYLEDVFSHLLENAVEYTTSDSPRVSVTVATTRTDARVSVRDEGPGLPEPQQRLLETGEITRYDDPGSGFGLNLVRLLIEGYGGSIETSVDAEGTTITVVLPRANAETFGVEASGSSLIGVRPNAPQLMIVLVASLLAAIPYGVVSEQLGGSVAAIGVFYGVSDPIVGWITHEFHSLVFGFVFAGIVAVLPGRYRESVPAMIAVGLGWAAVLWTVAAGVVAPVWLNLLGVSQDIPTFQGFLFWSHLAWGLTLAVLTVVGYRYVVPGLLRLGERLRRGDDSYKST